MAYSELIKNYEKIRSFIRDFYVYGFKGRDEFSAKSKRVYDDENRRVKGWLEDCMDSYYEETGKKVFISIDSRKIVRNPLYISFKTKSFTDRDIILHFCLLDILSDGEATLRQCMKALTERYLKDADIEMPDEGTVRNKLKEYEKLGILVSRKEGRNLWYSLSEDPECLPTWRDAISFYAETAPLGVIGSYFPRDDTGLFEYKHRYMLDALDSEILCDLFDCMHEHRGAELTVLSRRKDTVKLHTVYPAKLYFSTQTGRQYVLCFHYREKKPVFFRLDGIRNVKKLGIEKHPEKYEAFWKELDKHLWGTSPGEHSLDHLEMDVHVGAGEEFIVSRLEREKRHGTVEQIDRETWRFSADVYDASEMLPWLRTFIGRIDRLECSSPFVTERFRNDLQEMRNMYRGDCNAV